MNKAKVLSITNSENNSIAKLSDVNLPYHFSEEFSAYDPLENLTSQLPVIAFIEILAHRASKK
ncbi:MAG: hypothetical protein LBV19_06295 [Streptococcaceae bacterium]|jgi:DNA-binding MurR/RpiR family transcriptional regulator|nr:hypothetical protein [Streptococcaceae bacterium]